MAAFLHLTLLLATYAVSTIAGGSSPSPSPSPMQSTANCFDVVTGMMDCLPYMQEGSRENKPSFTCCDELKNVVSTNPACLCQGIEMAPKYGIELDVKKATGLPRACGVPPSDFGGCGAPSGPSPSPDVPSPSLPRSPPPSESTPPQASPPVSSPPSVLASPPHSVPTPPPTASTPPPVTPPPPPHSSAPPALPTTPAPTFTPVEPPAQSSQPPSPAPLSSGSLKFSCSTLAICVGVAIASFSYLDA